MEFVKCNLCGSDQYQRLFSKKDPSFFDNQELTIVRCLNCYLMFLNPRPNPAEMASIYSMNYKYHDFSIEKPKKQRTRIKQIQKLLSRALDRWIMEDYYGYPRKTRQGFLPYLRKWMLLPAMINKKLKRKDFIPYLGNGKLLDVGCGIGDNVAKFLDYGWDAYGVDVSEAAVKYARNRLGDRVFLGDLVSTKFADGSFDVVFFRHSLEHVHDPIGVLKETCRILKNEGLVVIFLPNIGSWEANIFSKHWMALDLPWHLYHFDPLSLQASLAKTGFQCIRIRTTLDSGGFMDSLKSAVNGKWDKHIFLRKLIDRCFAKPFCTVAGLFGHGAEMEIYAKKVKDLH